MALLQSLRTYFFILLATVGFFLIASPLNAANEFHTKLQTQVRVSESGNTLVEHHLTVTNRTPTALARRIAFQVASPNLTGVTVTENNKPLKAQVVSTDTHTSIGIDFADTVVGERKQHQVVISYESRDSSLVTGQVLEVSIPPLSQAETYDEYSVVFYTPKRFGLPSRVLPGTFTNTEDETNVITTVTPSGGEAVSILFGSAQTYQFSLKFPLINSTSQPSLAQVALPPDTAYQQISFTKLEPTPTHIKADQDGNWIATYEVPASSQLEAVVEGQAQVHLEAGTHFIAQPPHRSLTESQSFWELNEAIVKTKAQELQTIDTIYTHVVSTFRYNANRVAQAGDGSPERLGAASALAHPDQATCLEFTDTFIALARANGIPARRVIGYAHSPNQVLRPSCLFKKTLHTWPEYFDQSEQRWIPVDPTWQHTTGGVDFWRHLDLNHLTLAINGVSSEQPLPIGLSVDLNPSITTEITPSIKIELINEWMATSPQLSVTLKPKTLAGLPLPGYYRAIISNQTGQAWHHLRLVSTTTNAQISVVSTDDASVLPWQTQDIPVTITTNSWFKPFSTQLQLRVTHDQPRSNITTQSETTQAEGEFETTQSFQVFAAPQIFSVFQSRFFTPVVLGSVGLTLGAGSLLVLRRRRHRLIRR
jgi:transglutaminase-like putative cysteine protease